MEFGLTLSDVLMLPMTLLVIGALTYGEAFIRGKDKERLPGYRWIGVVFIALATLFGAKFAWKIVNPSFDGQVYRSTFVGRKIVAAHYISFLFPLLTLVAIYLLERWFVRYQSASE